MGFCLSCCRRRRDPKSSKHQDGDSERQPLLRTDTDALNLKDKHPESRSPYEKVADALAAVRAGKLPSQQQFDEALRKLVLRSGVLDVDEESVESVVDNAGLAKRGGEDAALNEKVQKVLLDAREVVEALLQVGLEKNDDNRVQDLLLQLRELGAQDRVVPVSVEAPPEVDVNVSDGMSDKMQTTASAIPSQNELASDTTAVIASVNTLARPFLTSSTFRLIIGDLFATSRQFVADSAVQVRKAAEAVEHVTEAVEVNVRPDSDVASGVQPVNVPDVQVQVHEEAQTEVTEAPSGAETKSAKEVTLERVEDIFRRAQASPQYSSALRTLLYVFRKYAERVSLASTVISEATSPTPGESSSIQISAPVIVPDPRFTRILEDFRVVLERLAGGKSLEPLLQRLFKTVHDVSGVSANDANSDVQIFFEKVGKWLDKALEDPSFVTSKTGQDDASSLYDDAHALLSQDTQFSENVQQLVEEANAFIDALKSDRSTNKLFKALDDLQSDVLTLLGQTKETGKRAATHWRTILLRAILGWVLPRLLRAIRVLPMPRFEYVSSSNDGRTKIEAAIDALLLSAEESLVPDALSVQEFAEVRVEVDESVGAAELINPNARLLSARKNIDTDSSRDGDRDRGQSDLENGIRSLTRGYENTETNNSRKRNDRKTRTSTTSRIRIHLEGLRLAAHDVGYYASYARNSWLGYADEGLLSVEIGRGRHRRGEGLAVDVELETDSDIKEHGNNNLEEDEKLFRILDVRTAIPGLALHIANSRHWILNCLLAPLAGPVGRTIAPYMLNAQIRNALERLENLLREIKSKADKKRINRIRNREGGGGVESQEQTSASDWWDALLERFGSDSEASEEQEDEEEQGWEEQGDEQDVYTESHTEPHLTGIVHTTIEAPEPGPGQIPADLPAESAIAVGVGAQLLPGKAEPTALGVERESPGEAAQEVAKAGREAIEDVQGKAQNVREGVQDVESRGIEDAVKVRRMAEAAGERMERQGRREKKKGGWRSRAFDL